MATVQTLNDKDGNTFYPVTKTEAVYNADGSKTLDYILDNTITASEDPADANKVFKGNASLGLVGPNNIDWSSFPQESLSNLSSYLGQNWSLITSNDTNYVVRYGKLVFVAMALQCSGSINAGDYAIPMTLPSGWRPAKNVSFGASYVYDNPVADVYLRSTGELVARPQANKTNLTITINATYMLS